MSNTGYKGITRIDVDDPPKRRKHGFQVYVGWRGKELREFHSGDSINEALRLRAWLEGRLDKPRTEEHIRSSGITRTAKGERVEWTR